MLEWGAFNNDLMKAGMPAFIRFIKPSALEMVCQSPKSYFLIIGQLPSVKGRKAWSPGTVATTL